MFPVSVSEVMQTRVETIERGATVREAAAGLADSGIGSLVITDGDRPVGIVTTTDLSNYLPHLPRPERDRPEGTGGERRDARADTAYEDENWDHEYVGDEAEIDVGETSRFTKTLTEADVEAFAEASGDTNRLHLDDAYAAETRFGERIAHGTLVVGTISAALARLPGLTVYLSQDVSYLGPVPIGADVTAECEVVERIGEDRFRLTTTVERADGEVVIDGEAVVMSDAVPDV